MTGGSIAVRARGSTGCTTSPSSRLAAVRFESDRSRVVEPLVWLRCIFRVVEATLLRCLTDACIQTISTFNRQTTTSKQGTHRSRPMEHADAEVPQQQPAVFSYASYPIVAFVA